MMLHSALLLASTFALLTSATPVADPKATTVSAAPAASSSVTASYLTGTVYFASTQCVYTSTTSRYTAGQCADLTWDTGNNSYQATFTRGNDYPGESCTVDFYNTTNCTGPITAAVPATQVNGACQAQTHPNSAKFYCG